MSILKEYSDLYEYLMPEISGCPKPMILSYIKQKVYDFCDQTEAWLEWLDPIKLVEGRTVYYLDCDYDAEIRRIKLLRINTEDGVDNGDEGQPIDPEYYEFDPTDDNKLTLADGLEPTEDISQGLEIRVVLVPLISAETISRCFLNRWHKPIRAGVLYELLSMEDQPWSKPNRALKFYNDWNNGLSAAKSEHHKKGTVRPLKISA